MASSSSPPAVPISVLFIGNSFTYFNDLPYCVTQLCRQNGDLNVETVAVTKGGESLLGHSTTPRVKAALTSRKWDYVVLQDHSGQPGDARGKRKETIQCLLEFYLPTISENHPGTVILLYETWGHQHKCVTEKYQQAYPDFPTMQEATTVGIRMYHKALVEAGATMTRIVPVGRAFELVYNAGVNSKEVKETSVGLKEARPASSQLFSQLYSPDTFHPSKFGTYLSACCFYTVLTGRSPIDNPWTPALGFGDPSWDHEFRRRFGSTWVPKDVTKEVGSILQRYAHMATSPTTPLVWTTKSRREVLKVGASSDDLLLEK